MHYCSETFDVSALSRFIREQARKEGFDKVGIVPASALAPERGRLVEWLARDYHADMRWMERAPELRTDPRLLFPGAKSIVVVALNYFTSHEHQENPQTGKISRYAWGDDYHDVVGERLRNLLSRIREQWPGIEGKACVDIQPMMDKAWAARAGLGWIGKHSNLITRELGSWIFIGELILNAELEYDNQEVPDHCGTCTLCIDSCPTGAIVAPYVVDSNRCISYATIELRDEQIPTEVAENLNGWLYGCDICQDVCPWNRFEEPSSEERFEPRHGNVNADLEDILSMSHDQYIERFRKSAIKRAKLKGLQRNARELMQRQACSEVKDDEGNRQDSRPVAPGI